MFSLRHERTRDATERREVVVHVRGGYNPDRIYAEAGVPLRVIFERPPDSVNLRLCTAPHRRPSSVGRPRH